MKNLVRNELLKYYPNFTESEVSSGLALFDHARYKAKDHFSLAGKVCKYLFFTSSSITRCYYMDDEGVEHTLWMKPEQTFITEYKSFVQQDASRFSLQFYEETDVMMISREDLLSLYAESQAWANFGALLTERVHITLIDVFVNLLANDATSNYQYIEYMFPRFLQVAPLKDIASMLQISPVSLSRIRAGTQKRN